MHSRDNVLRALGARARALRIARGWTLREAAELSGLSSRFLVQLESGRGNISVSRLVDVATAFGTTASALLNESPRANKPVIALLGLRGAGKTSVGRRLARRLSIPFVELDRKIEDAAELTLSEAYYRRVERDTLESLLAHAEPMVLATGGGLVTAPESLAILRHAAITIWLRATPEDHWNRVVRQGDRRPMKDHPQAMADLRALLAARAQLYASADHTIDTSRLSVNGVVAAIDRALSGA
jgi:XRE family aerobic/anaerobic benzoate catabolism transcriptional regulator